MPNRISKARIAAVAAACGFVSACAKAPPPLPPPPPAAALEPRAKPGIDAEVYRRAEAERVAHFERELARLRADLRQAEEALVAAESGLRGTHTRADAVSSLAEARIEVERASDAAPWRAGDIAEAEAKLAEADRQVEDGHYGATLFFAQRARRIAEAVQAEASEVRAHADTRFVGAPRVNLRGGPSTADPVLTVLILDTPVFPETHEGSWALVRTAAGHVGWVHRRLLTSTPHSSPSTITQSRPAALAR